MTDSFTCIPSVITGSPGQAAGKRREKVEKSPGQNYNVADTSIENDHLAGEANACKQN